ncbi:MAG: thiamine pyrophosphate-dependent enzyme, partial [Micropruina sp.]
PDTGAVVARLASAAKVPLIAEPSSNARRGSAALATGRRVVDSDVGRAIERVVVFGHPTLSRPVNRLLSRADVELIVVSETSGWVDPGWRAGQVASAVALEPTDGSWLEAWVAADRHRSRQVADVLAGTPGMTGQGLAAAVLASQADGLVVLGNSNAIRDADLAPIAQRPPAVYANRGLSGIDGLVSTAIGVALGGAGRPATLLCGDLTFLHDANGLAAGLGERRPDLRIVVADDNGGSIFATLEYGAPEFAKSFERVFATPSGVDLVALARAYGLPARRVSDAGEVTAALARPISGVDVLVVGLDRRNRRDVASRL